MTRGPGAIRALGASGRSIHPMCANCVIAASTTVTGAAGARVWLQTRGAAWVTPRRLKAATIALFVVALLGSAVGFGGSGG